MASFRSGDSFANGEEVLREVRGYFRRRGRSVNLSGLRRQGPRWIVYLQHSPALDGVEAREVGPADRVPGTRMVVELRGISVRWIRPAPPASRAPQTFDDFPPALTGEGYKVEYFPETVL